MKAFSLLSLAGLLACAPQPPLPSAEHLSQATPTPLIMPPKPPPPDDRQQVLRRRFQKKYSFSVSHLPLQALLSVFIQESLHNIVLDDQLSGVVSLKVNQQTLPDILDLLAELVDLRYQFTENGLLIQQDKAYVKSYVVNYLNLQRETLSETTLITQVTANAQSDSQANNTRSQIRNQSKHDFWPNLQQQLQSLLLTDSSAENTVDSIRILPEIGVVSVRATAKQHREIAQLLALVEQNAQRQVLIEATIAEVQLNQQHQAGIDWQAMGKYLGGEQQLTDVNLQHNPFFALLYHNNIANTDIHLALRLLRQFGEVQILSSPKILALNNQTALLRVVDNRVYFTIDVEISEGNNNQTRREIYTSHVNTVPEGLIIQVTPQISADHFVSLNIRPSVSRIIGFVNDPNPTLAQVGIKNPIPEIQVREIETVLRVENNHVAVIGGLMQDKHSENSAGIPVLSQLSDMGALFRYDDRQYKKTELVLFLRPLVLN